MNTDYLKWAGGGVMLIIWAIVVLLGKDTTPGAQGLIQFIQMSLVGLGAHGLTVSGTRGDGSAAASATPAPVAGVALPNGDQRPHLFVPGQTGSITWGLVVILTLLTLALCWVLSGCTTTMAAYETAATKEIKASDDNLISNYKALFCALPYSAIVRNPEIIPGVKALCLPGGNMTNPADLLPSPSAPVQVQIVPPPSAAK